jgi:hypothetical protein
MGSLEARLAACKLVLHPQKTKLVYCRDANRRGDFPIREFDFLGYRFRPREAIWRGCQSGGDINRAFPSCPLPARPRHVPSRMELLGCSPEAEFVAFIAARVLASGDPRPCPGPGLSAPQGA